MRLYVNTKEIPFLKAALLGALTSTATASPEEERLSNLSNLSNPTNLYERVLLCEALQKNEKRTKTNNE